MLKNYIKIAWKVLQRRKFFTFISLFGISFTLMVLMVLTSFVDHLISPNYPETKRDKSLYISFAIMSDPATNSTWSGGPGFHFLNKYVTQMKTPKKISIASMEPNFVAAFSGTAKLELGIKYTNAAFWEVMDFDFLEGKPYHQQELDNAAKVAVINEKTKKGYFGDQTNVVGEYIEIGVDKYRVLGVVKGVPITRIHSYGDVYLPVTTNETVLKDKNLVSGYGAILLAEDKADFSAIQAELQGILPHVEKHPRYPEFKTAADTYLDSFAKGLFFNGESGTSPFFIILGLFAFLFMLLPAINLININVNRIMERSSEIGVRKAFGATSSVLVVQFIVENLLITFIGGLIGIGLSVITIYWLNNSGLIAHLDLRINWLVLTISLICCVVFGLLSGVLPAFRMSKMNVVTALKDNF